MEFDNGNDVNNNSEAFLRINQKRVQEYADEYHEMPMCAEKLILKLICVCEDHDLNDGPVDSPSEILADIETRLKEEKISSKKVDELLKKRMKPDKMMLEQMLANIRDVNLHRLQKLTTCNNEAVEIIRDQNIYLFMGLTGHGKSTTIHYLAGSHFEEYQINGQVVHFASGRPHYVPRPCNRELEHVTTSPYPESDTHNIIPVVVTLPDGRQVIMCDSPGFEDTNGVELDIANSIAIERAIAKCKGVKPIIVISKNTGERMIGLTELSKILSRMVPNLHLNVNNFTYVFTNYKRNEAHFINPNINDLMQTTSFQNCTDDNFKTLIKHLKIKSRQPIIIDLEDRRNQPDIHSELFDDFFIQKPSEFFKLTLGVGSQKALSSQIDKHIAAIRNGLDRNDNQLVVYKTKQLMYLRQILDGMEVFERKFDGLKSLIEEYFKNKAFKMWPQQHEITNQDLDSFCAALNECRTMKEFKKMLFENENSLDSLVSDFDQFVDTMVELNDSRFKNIKLANLRLMDSYFANSCFAQEFSPRINQKYKEACQFLRDEQKEKAKICIDVIELNPPKSIGKMLNDLYSFEIIYNDYLRDEKRSILMDSSFDYISVANKVKGHIEKRLNESLGIVENIDENSFPKLDSNEKYMRHFLDEIRSYEFMRNEDQNMINSIKCSHDELMHKVCQVFESFKNRMETEIERPDLNTKYKQLLLLRKNDEIARITEKHLVDIKYKIESELLRILNNIYDQLSLSPDRMLEINTDKVLDTVQRLQKLKWVDEFIDNQPCTSNLRDIESNLERNVQKISEVLEKLDLSEPRVRDNDDKLRKATQLAKNIYSYKMFGKVFPNITDVVDTKLRDFEDKLEKILIEIGQLFENDDMDDSSDKFKKAEAEWNFVKILEKYQDRQSAEMKSCRKQAQSKLEANLKGLHDRISQKLDDQLSVVGEFENEDLVKNGAKYIGAQLTDMLEGLNFEIFKPFGFNELFDSVKSKLQELCEDLERTFHLSELKSIESPSYLQNDLKKVKHLFVLDKFLGTEAGDLKFKLIYNRYTLKSAELANRAFNEAEYLLKENSFKQLLNKFKFFETSQEPAHKIYIDQIKKKFNRWVEDSVRDLKILVSSSFDLRHDELSRIKVLLANIDQANFHLSDYLENKQELGELKKSVEESMRSHIEKYLCNLDHHLDSFDFKYFSEKLDEILVEKRLLNELCGQNTEVRKKLDYWSVNRNNAFRQKITEKFKNLDLDAYYTQPPSVIWSKLSNYPTEYDWLQTLILQKYTHEIEAAKECAEFPNEIYRKCHRNTIYLPREIRDEVQRMLTDCYNEKKNNHTDEAGKNNSDLDKLEKGNELLEECQKNLERKMFEHVYVKLKFFDEWSDGSWKNYTEIIKRNINEFIKNTATEVKSLATDLQDLNNESLTKLKGLLLTMDQAHINLSNYIEHSVVELIKDTKQMVMVSISDILEENLIKMKKEITSFEVNQFESKRNRIIENKLILKELCQDDANVMQIIDTVSCMSVEKELQEVIHECFIDLDIDSYFSNPPSVVFLKLAGYPTEREILKSLIIRKYNMELKDNTSLENETYTKFELSRSYLWEELSIEVGQMLEIHKAQTMRNQNPQEICQKNEEKSNTKIKEATPENIKLIQSLVDKHTIKNQAVKNVMLAVDRKYFAPNSPYEDTPQKIGYGTTISAPHMHAHTLEALKEKLIPGARVLDVGSGSGYLTACFAVMVGCYGKVVGIDHIKELVEKARESISKSNPEILNSGNLTLITGDGRKGYPKEAPYDAICIGAATPQVPKDIIDQLSAGGRIVLPLGLPGESQEFVAYDKKPDGSLVKTVLFGVRYVPLTDKETQLKSG